MVFFRCAGDHHSIALVPTTKPKRPPEDAGLQFHHLAMEVATIEEVVAAREFLRERGVPIVYEGRRGPGGNAGVEFLDPDGYMFEIYAKMDQTPADGRSRPSSQWRRATTLEEAIENPLPERW
jgi:catechol 2,3-dioxygenase-like lactoylglutathione lyase family enzyme